MIYIKSDSIAPTDGQKSESKLPHRVDMDDIEFKVVVPLGVVFAMSKLDPSHVIWQYKVNTTCFYYTLFCYFVSFSASILKFWPNCSNFSEIFVQNTYSSYSWT